MDFSGLIDSLNTCLYQREFKLYDSFSKSTPKTIHVIGAPRSGTTLLTQLIASFCEVGHVNNLIAAFYKTPLHGIKLSKKLFRDNFVSNFNSNFGSTSEALEPHEFSYFWKYHLKYNDFTQLPVEHGKNIDWIHLRTVLSAMQSSFEKPILFKSFHYGFHAAQAIKKMPNTFFILIKRNAIDNASSILKMRYKLKGSEEEWASFLPSEYSKFNTCNKYEQSLWQVERLNQIYEDQLSNIHDSRKLIINYEDLQNKTTLDLISNRFNLKLKDHITYPEIRIRKNSMTVQQMEKFLEAQKSLNSLLN